MRVLHVQPSPEERQLLAGAGAIEAGPGCWSVPDAHFQWIQETIAANGRSTAKPAPSRSSTSHAGPLTQQYSIEELHKLLNFAADNEATDILLVTGSTPRIRVNLELQEVPMAVRILDKNSILTFFNSLLETGWNQNNHDLIKNHLETEGWADFSFTVDKATARGNIFREHNGYGLALRLFHRVHVSLPFLGMEHMIHFAKWNQGLILLTGPTGSAKTTVASAMMEWLNTHCAIYIASIEDPVEYPIPGRKSLIIQRSVTDGHVRNFAQGLRSLMRQNPNLILIGEIRDHEVLNQVFSAAESGHRVITTFHAGSIADAYSRIVNLFPAGEQERIRNTLPTTQTVVVNQRLVHSSTPGHALLVHELFHNQVSAAFATIRDGQWTTLQNLQLANPTDMRHWDRELARLTKCGKLLPEKAKSLARDTDSYLRFLNQPT